MKFTKSLSVALVALYTGSVNARKTLWNPAEMTVYACEEGMAYGAAFDFGNPGYYSTPCLYPPATGTVLLCGYNRFNGDETIMESYIDNFLFQCQVYGGLNVTRDYFVEQLANATSDYLPFDPSRNVSLPVYKAFIVNPEVDDAAYNEYYWWYYNFDESRYWGAGIIVYWGGVLLILAAFHFMRVTGVIKSVNFKWLNYLRKWFTLPTWFISGKHAQPASTWEVIEGCCYCIGLTQLCRALPGVRSIKKNVISVYDTIFEVTPGYEKTRMGKIFKFIGLCFSSPFYTLLPTRLESILSAGYFIIHFVFLFIDYHIPSQFYLFTGRAQWVQRLLADRTGIISFAHIPLLIAFSGRNNILCWVTGLNYASFIQFHKVLASVMFLDAMIHSVAYTVYSLGNYVADLKQVYYAAGVAATVIGGFVILFALFPFRRFQYEFFLYTHIVLVICFIALCWWHCIDLGWMEWLYASIALWSFDRFIRLIRLAGFGIRKAELSIVDDETMKLTCEKPSWYKSYPGNYAFVYALDSLLFWQSHPFTVIDDGSSLTMYIKAKTGLTRRVYSKLLEIPEHKRTLSISLEGPYGASSPTSKYDNSLLIAGGNGFPGLLDRAVKSSKKDSNKPVKFIWITQYLKDISFVSEQLLSLKNSNVSVDIYLTKEIKKEGEVEKIENSGNDETSSNDDEKKSSSLSLSESLDFINFQYVRPDVREIVNQELNNNDNSGSMAVVTCGPAKMVDTLRDSVAENVVSYPARLDLFEEFQTW
ncbi:hypothetical protein B5S29_g4142 [[Candida] boidinii]|nr:hypothetical protein B5S29_g4142 [[Candida] boidinii]